jgi:triacylglycerol esterase/lipase EstA (alpha/beta hydrolase family)
MGANPVQDLLVGVIPVLGRWWQHVWFVGQPPPGRPLANPPHNRDPIVLVHGLADNWFGSTFWRRALERDGFRHVYTPDLPRGGAGGAAESAAHLKRYVDWVRRVTGARKVDLVGHSQGGVTIRYYIRFLGGADVVDSAITMGAPHHGVSGWPAVYSAVRAIPLLGPLLTDALAPPGAVELFQNSSLLRRLNEGDETPGACVRWTSIFSKDFDGSVPPADSPRLRGARNVVMHKERHFTGLAAGPDHASMFFTSDEAYEAVRSALLEPAPSSRRARR